MALCPVCGNHDGPETHCKRCHHVHDQLWLEDDLPDALRVLLVDPAELRHRRQQLRPTVQDRLQARRPQLQPLQMGKRRPHAPTKRPDQVGAAARNRSQGARMTILRRSRRKRGLNLPTALGPSRELPDVTPMSRERTRQRWAEEINRAHPTVTDGTTGAVLLEEIIPDTLAALSIPNQEED